MIPSMLRSLALCLLVLAGGLAAVQAEDAPAGAGTDPAAPADPAPVTEADRLVLNGLAGLTADSLTGFRDRPLFTPSRQPPAPPQVAEPDPQPQPEPQPEPEPEVTPPNVRLAGVLDTSEAAFAMIQDLGSGTTKPYKAGDLIEDWTLDSIDGTSVRLSYEGRTVDLHMFQPGEAAPSGEAIGEPGMDPTVDQDPQAHGAFNQRRQPMPGHDLRPPQQRNGMVSGPKQDYQPSEEVVPPNADVLDEPSAAMGGGSLDADPQDQGGSFDGQETPGAGDDAPAADPALGNDAFPITEPQ